MGVEEEFMENIENSFNWYQKSVNILLEHQVNNESLIEKFKQAYEAAKSVICINWTAYLKFFQQKFATMQYRPNSNNRSASLTRNRPPSAHYPDIRILSRDSRRPSETVKGGKSTQFYFQNNRIVEKRSTGFNYSGAATPK